MREVFTGICGLFATTLAMGAVYTWTGAGDATKWTDPANWGGAAYPTGGDTARFTEDAGEITEDFAIGAGVLTIDVATDREVYLKGVISGAGGITKTNAGKVHLHNAANTYAGATTVGAGQLWYTSLANVGEASSLGAPAAEQATITMNGVLYMETQSDASATYRTDRPFHFVNGCTFRLSYQSTKVYLDGPITGTGVTWRGLGDIYVASYLSSTFTGNFGRTDGGTVNLLCPTNAFHSTGNTSINLSDGAFRGTIADKGVSSGFGAGGKIVMGQQAYDTTGSVYYNGPTSTNCNRDLQIEVNQKGDYTARRFGGRLRNETAGTCLTMNGTLILKGGSTYVSRGTPWLWVGGAGAGVLTAPLKDNLCLEKEQTGTWTLTGASTTTGRVNIATGRLDIDGSLADGTGYDGPKVSVGNNTYLGGTGTVHGTVQMATGATLAPGHANELGTLTFGPAKIWFNTDSKFNVRIGAATNDLVVSSGEVACNGQVTVNVTPFGGETIPPGTYTLIQAESLTTPNFVLGEGAPEGALLVPDATRLRLFVPNAATRTLTWTGAASAAWDATAENWTAGGAATAFAAGDSVTFDDSGAPKTVTLDSDVTPMNVTVSASTAPYTIGGAGTIRATGSFLKEGTTNLTLLGTHVYDLDVEVKAGRLDLAGTLEGTSLKVADNACLNQLTEGVISGNDVVLTFGFGDNHLRGANTFTGNVLVDMRGVSEITEKALHLYGTQPLGHASSVTLYGFGTAWNTCGCLTLYSGTVVEDVTFVFGGVNAGSRRGYFRKASDGNNSKAAGCWYGSVVVEAGCQPNVQCQGGTFEIGRTDGTNTITGVGFNFRGSGTIKVNSRIDISGAIGRDDGGTTVLCHPDNRFSDSQGVQGYYRLGVANGWCTNAVMRLGKNNVAGMCGFNLDGFDQTLPGLVEQNPSFANENGQRRVWTPADKPATLTLAFERSDCIWGSTYGYSYIQGPLALVKTGPKSFILNGTNSFSGTTTVEAGLLKASVLGALGGTTNVVMKGGTLELGATGALNESADVHFAAGSTGKIQLDDGVQQVVQYLVYDELSAPRTAGTYGSSQSAASTKDNTRFSGTGVLVVRRGGGFTFFIR